uniref:Cellulase n=1 Tax=Schistosoma curassoni TaxID=6186 RepID=A0A183KT51_9TREM
MCSMLNQALYPTNGEEKKYNSYYFSCYLVANDA